MQLTRVMPVPPVARLRDEIDRLFGDFFDFGDHGGVAAGWPPLNVSEQAERLVVEAELPGVAMENLEIVVHDQQLEIKGERKPFAEEGLSFVRRERPHGAFRRLLPLPFEVDANQVSATLADGVLTIHLPKAAALRPRRIQVQAK